jgi:peptide/histidine transporter 3/4
MVLCTVSAHPDIKSSPLFFFGLFFGVALGSGGIKPNVVVLGADQFDPAVPEEKEQMESYFNYFYWSINIGAAFSFGFLAYLAVNGMGAIPKEFGFFASFVIPAVAMAIAIQVFIMGSGSYVKKEPKGSALSTFCGVVLDASHSSRTGQCVIAGPKPTLTLTLTFSW